MKKTIHFILPALISGMGMLHAQNPVPNASFENWTAGNPDDWTANNFGPGASPIMQEIPPNSGTYALRGEVILVGPVPFFPLVSSTDASAMGFPVSQLYGALTFYYKTNITGTSVFGAFVGINDPGGNTIGGGAMNYTGITSSFTQASIPIFYTAGNPAEGVIAFTITDTLGVPAVGDYFIVDDVELSGTVGMDEEAALRTGIEKIQPNPSGTLSTVYYTLAENADISFELLDITGRKYTELLLKNETAGKHKIEWDVSQVPAGYYIVQMKSQAYRQRVPLLVVH